MADNDGQMIKNAWQGSDRDLYFVHRRWAEELIIADAHLLKYRE